MSHEVGRFNTYESYEPNPETLDFDDLERRFTEFCAEENVDEDVWFHDLWGENEGETLGNLLSFAAQHGTDIDYFLSYMGVGDKAYGLLDLESEGEVE